MQMAGESALMKTPFSVGAAKVMLYGNPEEMAVRSTLMHTLVTTNVQELKAASTDKPFPLLSNVEGLEQVVLANFKSIWNYLNGVTSTDQRVTDMLTTQNIYTIMVLIIQLGVTNKQLLAGYLRKFLTESRRVLKGHAHRQLMRQVLSARPYFTVGWPQLEACQQVYEMMANVLHEPYRTGMLFGPTNSLVPKSHREILPVGGVFPYRMFDEVKDLWVSIYRQIPSAINGKVMVPSTCVGTYRVVSVAHRCPNRITRTTYEKADCLTAEQRKHRYTACDMSYEAAHDYFVRHLFLYMKVTTSIGDIALMEAPNRRTWLCPTLGFNGLKSTTVIGSAYAQVRFFAA